MGTPIRLLLVEDSDQDAFLLMRELIRAGFDVDHERVDDAETMRRALEEQKWDLVVSDYSMPGFDGLRALKILQASGQDLPFVIVSGAIGEDVAVDTMRAGAHDYVMKHNLARLGPAIRRELHEAEVRRARRRAEDGYRSMVESSLQGLLIIQDRRIAFANHAAAQMLGYTVKELLAMPPEQVTRSVAAEDRSRVWTSFQRRIAGENPPSRYELPLIRKNGSKLWVEVFASLIELDGRPAAQAAIIDISHRKQHEREQRAIATLATALRAARSRNQMMPLILEQVMDLLNADAAAIATRDTLTGGTALELAKGAWEHLSGALLPPDTGLSEIVYRTARLYHSNSAGDDSRLYHRSVLNAVTALAGVPLIAEEKVIGVLWIGRNADIAEEDVRVATAIAEMTASALRRITLFDRLLRSHQELVQAYDTTLEGWARALELRDGDTEGHTRRVAELSVRLGKALGLGQGELIDLQRGALLHDIGRMAIPDRILHEQGPLTTEELTLIEEHPKSAHHLLATIPQLQQALEVPYCHHERWDGGGYPQGLKGEEIPLAARIFAVVDVWDALRSDRIFRRAWSADKAKRYLHEEAGKAFDPKIVEPFLAIINEETGDRIGSTRAWHGTLPEPGP